MKTAESDSSPDISEFSALYEKQAVSAYGMALRLSENRAQGWVTIDFSKPCS